MLLRLLSASPKLSVAASVLAVSILSVIFGTDRTDLPASIHLEQSVKYASRCSATIDVLLPLLPYFIP